MSCSTKNDFENTNLYFEFDKETYLANDKFELTIKIVPIEAEQTIRLYKDLRNIEISFVSEAQQLGFNQKLTKRFIQGVPPQDQSEYIDEFTISKKKPFKRKFYGTISEYEESIVISIAALTKKFKINKSSLIKNPNILVKGNCRGILAMDGTPFEPNNIKIMVP
ncbi:MAG: hypothetical protein ABNH00_07465 [Dokdonia sp.]|jgi:hypothetical protein|tara:strand:- start:57 stop:551 length:495 start_codon:yes stop_codon:yes gene_type:complete